MNDRDDQRADLFHVVRRILLTVWDPIRLQELPESLRMANEDEYDSYVRDVVGMIVAGSDKREIIDYLFDAESKQMGQKCQNCRSEEAGSMISELQRVWRMAQDNSVESGR